MRLNEALQTIRERINLVDLVGRYVELKRNGNRYSAPCPFHQETKPSFSVNPDKGFFYCFGCHASGDLFEFYAKINGLDFRESVEQLAQEAGIVVEFGHSPSMRPTGEQRTDKKQILQMYELAAQAYQINLQSPSGLQCREYLQKRGVTPEIIEKFALGWAPEGWRFLTEKLLKKKHNLELAAQAGLISSSDKGNFYDRFRGRLIFPIKNLSGQVIAFGGRIIENTDEAKYINSADSPIYKKKEHLYGLYQARSSIGAKGFAMLTEGYMDVLTLNQFKYGNCAGVLGTALTEEQIRRLSGFCSRFLLIFDGDKAGRKAAFRSCEMLLARGLNCNVAILPPEDDIDSLLKSGGPQVFDELAANAPDGLKFCINVLKDMAPKDAVDWTREFLADVRVPELATTYASSLAAALRMEESSLRQNAAKTRNRRQPTNIGRAIFHNTRDRQIMIFAARYPERLAELRGMGAHMALSSESARELWKLIETWGPDEILLHLDESQKEFWIAQRGPAAAPLTNGDFELACLEKELDIFYAASKKASLSRALAETSKTSDFNAQLEYLRALQETLGNIDEQS